MAKKNNKKAFIDAVRARGGVRYFDLGGQLTTQPATPTQGLVQANPLANAPVIGPASNAGSQVIGNTIGGLGSATQGIAGAFTAQNPYQAKLAPIQQLDYSQLINQAGQQAGAGYGQTQGNLANEQALEQQLMAEGQGQGPNPAQAALANNTGTNVANQAALMANQRGGTANAGLLARQAAQQGAATQQQAVGQSAALQAQQQLAAQQGAAAVQGQIGNQITNQQAASNQLLGIGAGATNTQNANLISNYGQAQGINAQAAQQNANAVNQTTSGLLGGVSSLAALFAKGGEVSAAPAIPHYAEGGPVSFAGQYLNGSPNAMGEFAEVGNSVGQTAHAEVPTLAEAAKTGESLSKGISGIGKSVAGMAKGGEVFTVPGAASGGKVPAKLSPKEKVLPPDKVNSPVPLKEAKEVPGKAKVAGDSLKNDHVSAMLPPGSIVLPRSVTQAADAPRRAMAFVQAIQAKQGLKRGGKK